MQLAAEAMLAAAAAVAVVGTLLTLPRVFRVRRRVRALLGSLAAGQAETQALLAREAELWAEARDLRETELRLLRWLRHPLVRALWASYRIRRRQT